MSTSARRYFTAAIVWSGVAFVFLTALVVGSSASFGPLIIIGVGVPFVLSMAITALANARAKGAGRSAVVAARVLLGILIAELVLGLLAAFTPFVLFIIIGGITVALLIVGLSNVESTLARPTTPVSTPTTA